MKMHLKIRNIRATFWVFFVKMYGGFRVLVKSLFWFDVKLVGDGCIVMPNYDYNDQNCIL